MTNFSVMYENWLDNNGFTRVRPTTKKAEEIINSMRYTKDWYDLYTNPSITKQQIRDYWQRTFNEVNAHIIGYTGNCMTFSIFAENDRAYFYITKTYNYYIPKS